MSAFDLLGQIAAHPGRFGLSTIDQTEQVKGSKMNERNYIQRFDIPASVVETALSEGSMADLATVLLEDRERRAVLMLFATEEERAEFITAATEFAQAEEFDEIDEIAPFHCETGELRGDCAGIYVDAGQAVFLEAVVNDWISRHGPVRADTNEINCWQLLVVAPGRAAERLATMPLEGAEGRAPRRRLMEAEAKEERRKCGDGAVVLTFGSEEERHNFISLAEAEGGVVNAFGLEIAPPEVEAADLEEEDCPGVDLGEVGEEGVARLIAATARIREARREIVGRYHVLLVANPMVAYQIAREGRGCLLAGDDLRWG